jgi:hypothetical protein
MFFCSNSSLLEYSPPTAGALVEDGVDLGQVSPTAIWVKAYYLLAYIRACSPGINPCVTATCTVCVPHVEVSNSSLLECSPPTAEARVL